MAVDWFADDWGGRVHYGSDVPDAHDAAEAEAERGRG